MKKNTGFIGLGNMGGALIRGLSSTYGKNQMFGYDNEASKLKEFEDMVTACSSAQELMDKCDIIILAVKPYTVRPILEKLTSNKTSVIVSIAAGVTLETMALSTSADQKIIRVMPNTPALSGEGMTVLCPNRNVSEEELQEVSSIFAKTGRTMTTEEKHMDAVTAISGCGPAYFFTFIQAMADGGVKLGLSRENAVLLAAQTALGAAKMVMTSNEDPITLRNRVTSPGGSTIAAVHVLEQNGFSGIVMDAVEEAARVSSQLG
ncbi:MAG: pyrroline-5-carboxylate reductase [Spirochaetes bacterium]|nr:pyrroline-5-carboxylate reductase [Spirochaetota bacterium]MBN2772588.1 pyrroline-5-carboxylate reductase [Spirochaetota bacterium]